MNWKKILILNGMVQYVELGTLLYDGKVIDDLRNFGDKNEN